MSRQSVWLLTGDGILTELDRELNEVRSFETGIENAASAIPMGGFVWICECDEGKVVQFDPAQDTVVREIPLPADGFLIGVDTNSPRASRRGSSIRARTRSPTSMPVPAR